MRLGSLFFYHASLSLALCQALPPRSLMCALTNGYSAGMQECGRPQSGCY